MSNHAGPSRDALMRPSYDEAVEQGANVSNNPEEVAALLEVAAGGLSLGRRPSRLSATHLHLSRVLRANCCGGLEIADLAISPQGHIAVSQAVVKNVPTSGSTGIWDISTGKPERMYSVAGGQVVFAATPPTMVSIKESHVANVEGVDTFYGAEIKIKDHIKQKTLGSPDAARSAPLAFSPDGRRLVAGVGGNRMMVYNTAPHSRSALPMRKTSLITSHIDRVTHAQFTPDGDSVVTLSKDSTLRITDAATGRTLRRLEIEGPGSSQPRALGISPDGLAIVSIWGNQVHVWEPEMDSLTTYGLNVVRVKEGWPLCISPDCRYLACRNEDGMDISDVYTGKVLAQIEVAPGMESMVTAAAFSLEGRMLAIGRYNGYLEIWDMMHMEK